MMRLSILATFLLSAVVSLGQAAAENERSIVLVLDASGSMNAHLPDGTARIDAAKAAVAELIDKVAPGTRLALRVYGHQSPTQKKDCKDSALVVGFDTVERNRAAIVDSTRGIRAQGYTPINHVLTLAAQDVAKEESPERIVVLVSDGKETCEGDPCVTAKALAAADARLVVHTIGFGVDAAARRQLQCIAGMARGSYSDAGTSKELASALGEAARKPPVPKKTEIVITTPKLGKLQIKGADQNGHNVFHAVSGQRAKLIRPGTGQQVNNINSLWPTVDLDPGIYNVSFGPQLWKSIEVRAGETTLIEPGILEIKGATGTHMVLEPETGEVVAELMFAKTRSALIPSRFSVTFGDLVWPDVELKPGQTTTLRPGIIKVSGPGIYEYKVTMPGGQKAGTVDSGRSRLALPPGAYVLEIKERKIPIELKEGEEVEIKVQ